MRKRKQEFANERENIAIIMTFAFFNKKNEIYIVRCVILGSSHFACSSFAYFPFPQCANF